MTPYRTFTVFDRAANIRRNGDGLALMDFLEVVHSDACMDVAVAKRSGNACMARSKQLQADYWRRRKEAADLGSADQVR